jgi:hypothetical protein
MKLIVCPVPPRRLSGSDGQGGRNGDEGLPAPWGAEDEPEAVLNHEAVNEHLGVFERLDVADVEKLVNVAFYGVELGRFVGVGRRVLIGLSFGLRRLPFGG